MNGKDLNDLIKKEIYEAMGMVWEKSVPEPYNRYKAREMTPTQVERRDRVGKKMLNKPSTVSYFKDNYGDDWESWLWATATNIAMRGE